MPSETMSQPRSARFRRALVGIALGGVVLTYSAVFTSLAPGGKWTNAVRGEIMWRENDPGGYYLAAAHELLSRRDSQVFAGHPGLPMQIVLAGIQRTLYQLGDSGTSLSYAEYTARHLETVWWWSKMAATGCHLFSLYCLFLLARRLLGRPRAALLATIAYGSSFPVMYFLSRVSVEPWALAFYCLSFLALVRVEEAVRQDSPATASSWAAVVAICATSGAFTKMSLLAGLPAYLVAPLLLGSPGFTGEARPWSRPRVLATGVLIAVTLLAAALYSMLMDWRAFEAYWRAEGGAALAQAPTTAAWPRIIFARVSGAMCDISWKTFLPGTHGPNIVGLVELPFLVLASWGTFAWLRQSGLRTPLFWPGLYALATVPVWLVRTSGRGWTGFHYSIFVFVILAIGFGHLADGMASRLRQAGYVRASAVAIALPLALHVGAIGAATESRIHDIHEFRRQNIRDVYRAVRGIAPGERILVVGTVSRRVHGLVSYAPEDHPAKLIAAIDDILLFMDEVPENQRRRRGFMLRGVVRVLDARHNPASVLSLAQWIRVEKGTEKGSARGPLVSRGRNTRHQRVRHRVPLGGCGRSQRAPTGGGGCERSSEGGDWDGKGGPQSSRVSKT